MKLKNLFKRDKPIVTPTNEMISFNTWNYQRFNKSIVEMDIIRASVDALARNISKMTLESYIVKKDGTKEIDRTSNIARVLSRPNKYMTTYDFLYKVASMYFISNNVFIYPMFDSKGKLIELYPINYESFQLVELNNRLYAKFQMNYFNTYTCAYEDLIHLRNHFMTDDLCGASNSALGPVCELVNAQNQGIIEGIKNSAVIRGILKSVNVIKEEDLQKAKERFVKDNLSASNNGGVIVVDGKFDYKNIESNPYMIDAETMNVAKNKIFDYFGVNEEFLQNKFDSAGYEAVYEGKLEPFAIMLAQALTNGLFTEREIGFGNRIEATVNKMQYQPVKTITSMIQATNQLGLFTRNEYRQMLGYPCLTEEQGGNEILISLNYTKSDNLDDYQGVESGGNEEDEQDE